MINLQSFLFVSCFFAATLAYAGEFVPKSYYIIDHRGHQSDTIYFRSKRDVELFPLLRLKRGNAQPGAYSSSFSSSTGGGGSGGGGNIPNIPLNFDNIPFVGQIDPGFGYGGPGGSNIHEGGGAGGAHASSFASSSSSSSSGTPRGAGGFQHGNTGNQGPTLFSRFGEGEGTGIKVSGSAQGERGAFSSSSSSIDGNGKIKYSVQSGKY